MYLDNASDMCIPLAKGASLPWSVVVAVGVYVVGWAPNCSRDVDIVEPLLRCVSDNVVVSTGTDSGGSLSSRDSSVQVLDVHG